MYKKINIALSIPNADRPDRYFAFRLQQCLSNEPALYEMPSRLFVVSDIEGNFQPFCHILMRWKIIDKYFQWIYEDGHLVVLGDCFDRGEQVTECLWLIYSLEEGARRAGGRVHFILGNHEIMNLNGDWRYVHPKYAYNTSSFHLSPTALYDANSELWRWLCTKNIVEKIGNVLFVHGGIAPALLEYNLSVPEINEVARPWFTKANGSFTDQLLHLLFSGEDSPFWYRGYYNGLITEEIIDVILARFEVTTIITGHTMVEQVRSYFNGKVINVNTDHASGNSEGLVITKNQHFYRAMDKKRERIK